MICEKCKKKINKPSKTPQEAMRKFALKLKKENEKIKKTFYTISEKKIELKKNKPKKKNK